jgi:hypothetical protein
MICSAAAEGAFDTREKFMAILDKNPHLAVQGYNPYGKIFYWNEASAQVYGHSESAAVNQDLFELILPVEMRSFARDSILSAVKTGRMPQPGACNLLRRDGGTVAVFSGHLVFQWEGTSPEFYCIDLMVDQEA